MKHIIVGTNRPNSNTKKVALFIQKLYAQKGETVELIDLGDMEMPAIADGASFFGSKPLPPKLHKAVDDVSKSEGLILVCPEYNGGAPGIVKLFIDHWKFPDSFVGRPICYVGLGAGIWGALHPIDHISQIMAYRNAYQFPVRVFMREVNKLMTGDEVTDPFTLNLLNQQVEEFPKFCRALKAEGLDANSLIAKKK